LNCLENNDKKKVYTSSVQKYFLKKLFCSEVVESVDAEPVDRRVNSQGRLEEAL
jgi:hypothetical protein